MNRKTFEWLQGEIAVWEREGLLSSEQAARLRSRYVVSDSRPFLPLLLSIFGGLLIGLGVILLLAHNWDQIPRWSRTVVAYLPLLVAIGIAGRVLWNGGGTVGAREGAGVFLFFTTGAALSLVAQSYHIGGSFRSLLLLWMILAIPALYALEAAVPTLLYLVGITSWVIAQRSYGDLPYAYWLLLAAVLPVWVGLIRKTAFDRRAVWLSWGIALSASIAVTPSVQGEPPMPWLLGYVFFFAVQFLGFSHSLPDEGGAFSNAWQWPFRFIGSAGLGVVGWFLAFKVVWEETNPTHFWDAEISAVQGAMGVLFLVLSILAASVLLVVFWRKSAGPVRVGGLFPFLVYLLLAIHFHLDEAALPMVVVNLFLLVWAAMIVWRAIGTLRTGLLNAGLLLFSALVAARFFDSDLSYLVRGLVFVALGILFLAVNRWFAHHRRLS